MLRGGSDAVGDTAERGGSGLIGGGEGGGGGRGCRTPDVSLYGSNGKSPKWNRSCDAR